MILVQFMERYTIENSSRNNQFPISCSELIRVPNFSSIPNKLCLRVQSCFNTGTTSRVSKTASSSHVICVANSLVTPEQKSRSDNYEHCLWPKLWPPKPLGIREQALLQFICQLIQEKHAASASTPLPTHFFHLKKLTHQGKSSPILPQRSHCHRLHDRRGNVGT